MPCAIEAKLPVFVANYVKNPSVALILLKNTIDNHHEISYNILYIVIFYIISKNYSLMRYPQKGR